MKRLAGSLTLIAALALAGLFPGGLAAGEGPAATLTLPQAIEIAQQRSPLLKAGRQEVQAAGAGVDRARAGFLPKLDVSEGVARSDNPVFAFSSKLNQGRFTASDFAIGTLNHPDPINNFRTAVTLSQPLFAGGKTLFAYDRAKLDHGATRHRLERREQEVMFETARAYYEVRLAEAQLDVARAALRAADANRELARNRVGTGLVVESDVLSADVRLASVKEQEIVALNGVELAKASLNEVMGRPLDEAVEVTAQLAEPQPVTLDTSERLATVALAARPDYLGLGIEEQARARGVDAAQAEFLPTVSATASYEVNNLEVVTKGQDSWFLGLVLQWNLFNGFGDRAGVVEARARLAETRAVRDGAANRIRLEVKEALLRLRAATQRIDVARGAIAQAEDSFRIVKDRYDAGLTTIVDLLSTEAALTEARARLTRALYDRSVADANLALALGTISKDSFQ
jgi:outer membrane protein